jgi:hypothetical protein
MFSSKGLITPPYEQRWVMRSVGEFAFVGAVLPAERCA